jgi:hypothetical protein
MTGAAGAWVSGGASLGPLIQLLVTTQAAHPPAILWTIWGACVAACASMALLWATNGVSWRGAPGFGGGGDGGGVYKQVELRASSSGDSFATEFEESVGCSGEDVCDDDGGDVLDTSGSGVALAHSSEV